MRKNVPNFGASPHGVLMFLRQKIDKLQNDTQRMRILSNITKLRRQFSEIENMPRITVQMSIVD